MDDRLGLSDVALDACASSCAAANESLSGPSTASTSTLTGVTDLGARVSEFVLTLAAACGVLASSASNIRSSAIACRRGSDAVDDEAVAALAAVGGAGR